MSKKTMSKTMPLLSVIRQETTIPKIAFFLAVILLTGNLSALVDSLLHPEIPYFDEEHFIVGISYNILVCILFLGYAIYGAKRKLLQETLKKSEERYRNIFDNARDIIFTANKDTLFTSLNPAFELMTGWPREEWIGRSFAPILHPDDLAKADDALQKIMQGKKMEVFELRVLKRSGDYLIGEFTVASIRDGEAITALGHVRDVTKRKKIEEENKHLNKELERRVEERTAKLKKANDETKESEERFKAIFDNAADGILLADIENKRFYLGNRAICQMLGYSSKEISTLGMMDIHPKESLSYIAGIFEKFFKSNIKNASNIPIKRKDGNIFYADISALPVILKEKKYLIGIFRDITVRKLAEQELNNALFKAKAANIAKSEFLANMSHELTTPLNSVIGFSQVLKDGLYGELNEKQKEYVDDILQGGLHLFGILNKIIELARMESNKEEIKPDRFLLKDALKSSVAVFNDKAIKHNLKLTLEIEPDAEIEIDTDAGKLTRILHNLIDNAVKFTLDGGSVSVSARLLQGSKTPPLSPPLPRGEMGGRELIEISIADTGIGIIPENIDKLFKPFAQLESPYTKQYGGTGIGLVLTKRLVELLGGRISVESEYGKGSKFIFVIPVVKGEL